MIKKPIRTNTLFIGRLEYHLQHSLLIFVDSLDKYSNSTMDENFRTILLELFEMESTHITLDDAVKDISFVSIGIKPNHIPYSIWQLTEHIRITQKDIIDFCFNSSYKELNWPNDYWPNEIAPENEASWNKSLEEIRKDRKKMVDCIKDRSIDLLKPLHGDKSKNILREALLILDHTSYHIGEIVILRRLLEDWNR